MINTKKLTKLQPECASELNSLITGQKGRHSELSSLTNGYSCFTAIRIFLRQAALKSSGYKDDLKYYLTSSTTKDAKTQETK